MPKYAGMQKNYIILKIQVRTSVTVLLAAAMILLLSAGPARAADGKVVPLTDELKKTNNIYAVIFDGVITQRLLDIASDKGINTIVGIKIGNVIKKPASVKILTKDQLE